jgi:hypothetical protein
LPLPAMHYVSAGTFAGYWLRESSLTSLVLP